MRYTLTAKHGGKTRRATVYGRADNMDPKIVPLMVHDGATEQEIADADAAMSAIPLIMDRASGDEIWAKGSIVLRCEDGRVVKTMDAKD